MAVYVLEYSSVVWAKYDLDVRVTLVWQSAVTYKRTYVGQFIVAKERRVNLNTL